MLPERILSVMDGRVVDMLHLQARDVTVEGLADKLAKINRYNGATEYPYSVAQHAVLCSYISGGDLRSLHHDDAEAFTGDLITPIKHLPEVYAAFKPIESAVERQVLGFLGLLEHSWLPAETSDAVALRIEWQGLDLPRGLGFDPARIEVTPEHRELLRPMHWRTARDAYIERHRELVHGE